MNKIKLISITIITFIVLIASCDELKPENNNAKSQKNKREISTPTPDDPNSQKKQRESQTNLDDDITTGRYSVSLHQLPPFHL